MAMMTVRPFASPSHSLSSLRRPHRTRVVLPPVASSKGFGDPKKEQTKRPEPPQQQQQADPSTSSPSTLGTPSAAARRARATVATPQVVTDRIFKRIVICAGVPVFTGLALFPLFYWLRVVMDIDYPLWIVYVAQLATFGGGLLGITYGALSASWDPTREGSLVGWSELQTNIAIIIANRDNK